MIPLHDENPTQSRSWLTVLLIVVNVMAFVWIQPRDSGAQDIEFAYEYAAIPCEVLQGRPLTAAENPVTNGGREGVCGDEFDGATQDCSTVRRGTNCTIFPDKLVWVAIVYSMFLHGSWLHLGFNMLFLWVFGNNIEDHLGKWRYALFYLAAGVVATVAHIAIDTSSTVPLVGASGAVAGVMGAYLVWFPNARVRTLVFMLIVFFVRIEAKWLLLIWLVSQFFIDPNEGVAWMAHVGGFVFGVVIGLLIRESPRLRHAAWTPQYADEDSGLWDTRFGGRLSDSSPPYDPPGI